LASERHFLLLYRYVPDILERRDPYRAEHLELVRGWKADGRIVIAGALGDPPHGAAFGFRVDDRAEIDRFVSADPYVAAGLVTERRVEPWTVV
jgi:uncharacterized protein